MGGVVRVRNLFVVLAFALASMCAPLRAQAPLTSSDFNIDLLATPALGSSRTIGMAGAYTALAEGVDGVTYNPAAWGARASWERDWWDYELGLGIQFPGAYVASDYFLNGRGRDLGVDHFSAVDFSGRLQLGDLGFGATSSLQDFRLEAEGDTRFDVNTSRFGAAYALFDGQLVLGLGVRFVDFDMVQGETPLVSFSGVTGEGGSESPSVYSSELNVLSTANETPLQSHLDHVGTSEH